MRAWSTSTARDLRRLLNEWDPIGVADLVGDEYDCMIAPLFGRLRAGAGRAEIDAFLRHELEDHFGLGPSGPQPGAPAEQAMAARVLAWWAAGDRDGAAAGA
ncbi:hypothetical protein ACFWSF_33820 [Streptomyces sp. NPDC058611]|uniref:hypothetical protein n=1 Tax=unclassified Streptomyces TaxID=2593676 RepID=UPI003654071C